VLAREPHVANTCPVSNAATAKSKAGRRPADCEVCILAGGASRRMHRDKTRLRLGRHTLLGLVRTTAAGLGVPVRVIRRDVVPGCGPLGGIQTGLCTSQVSTLLFLSCDMPFISVGLLRTLRSELGRQWQAAGATHAGRIGFPLLLRRSVLPVVERRLRHGRWSIQSLARALGARRVRVPAARAHELWNLNTPEDWTEAKAFWRERQGRGEGRAGRTRRKRGLSSA
jgi:molybdenum cofactor guanylyltransferase